MSFDLIRAREMLGQVVKYAREDRAVTPRSTRLSRLVDEIESYLARPLELEPVPAGVAGPYDRCAYFFADGSRCGLWQDSHGLTVFRPETAHAFVEPGPCPAYREHGLVCAGTERHEGDHGPTMEGILTSLKYGTHAV